MKFKKLTVENWNEADPSSGVVVKFNQRTGVETKLTGEDWAEKFLEEELSSKVPSDVVEMYHVARGVLLYGWYFYPLYVHGCQQMSQLLEAAAHHKCEMHDAPKNKVKRFADKINWLIENRYMREERKSQWSLSD